MSRITLTLVALFVCLTAASEDSSRVALSTFNSWLAEGLTLANATVAVRVLPLDKDVLPNIDLRTVPLRIVVTHGSSVATFPRVSLPLSSHVLGHAMIVKRPYYRWLRNVTLKTEDDVLHMLTLALMAEMALWDASPVRPWCQFLLMEPKSIGLSSPPLLWPKKLLEEVEPRYVRELMVGRRKAVEARFENNETQRILTSMSSLTRTNEAAKFQMSKMNYVRVRAIVESNAVHTTGAGIVVVPVAGFLEYAYSFDRLPLSHEADNFDGTQATVRHASPSSMHADASGDTWTMLPSHRHVLMSHTFNVAPADFTAGILTVDLGKKMSAEEYFVNFGRLPARLPWEIADCQLIVFSKTLSQKRSDIKERISIALGPYFHHYSCVTEESLTPYHGLLGALISELPKETPRSVEHCANVIVEKHAARIGRGDAEMLYRGMIDCLYEAPWHSEAPLLGLLHAHVKALIESIKAYEADQMIRRKSIDDDEVVLQGVSPAIGLGSDTERHAAVTLRIHRKRIFELVLERLAEFSVVRSAGHPTDDNQEIRTPQSIVEEL